MHWTDATVTLNYTNDDAELWNVITGMWRPDGTALLADDRFVVISYNMHGFNQGLEGTKEIIYKLMSWGNSTARALVSSSKLAQIKWSF